MNGINGVIKTKGPFTFALILFTVLEFFYIPFILDFSLWSKFAGVSVLVFAFSFLNTIFPNFLISREIIKQFIWIFLFLLVAFISLFFSLNIFISVNQLIKYFLFTALLIQLSTILTYVDIKSVISKLSSLFVLFSVLFALIQAKSFNISHDFHQNTYLISSFFSHRNLFAEVLLLNLGFVLYGVFTLKKLWKIISIISLFFITTGTIILTVRSVWIAFFVFFVSLFFLVFFKKSSLLNRRNIIYFSLLIFALFLLPIFIYKPFKTVVTKQFYWLKNPTFGSSNERLKLWYSTIDIIKDKPILGVGPGCWKIAYPHYYKGEIRKVNNGIYTQFQRTHNDYLQILSETGIMSGISLVIFIFLVLYKNLKIIKITENQNDKLWYILVFCSILAYLVISIFGFPSERMEQFSLLAINISFVISFSFGNAQNQNVNKYEHMVLQLSILVISLFALILSYFQLKGEYYTSMLYKAKEAGEHQFVIDYGKLAQSKYYQIDPVSVPLSFYQGAASFALGNLKQSISFYANACKTAPFHKQSIHDLASCYVIDNKTNTAITLYKNVIELAPDYEDALVNLSIVYFNQKDYDSCFLYLSKCDTNSTQISYLNVVNSLNTSVCDYMLESSQTIKFFFNKCIYLLDNPEWQMSIFRNAIISHQKLEERVVEEVLFSITEMDKTIDKKMSYKIRNQVITNYYILLSKNQNK